MPQIIIDVFSDVICPWCFVGKRRLEKAMVLKRELSFEVRWQPFQLNPQMPKGGMDRKSYRTQKFGSWQKSLELDARLLQVGKVEGIPFAFDKMEKTPNTLDAHRIIWLAGENGCQDAIVERLFCTYFLEGRDIQGENLITLANEAGLPAEEVEAFLLSQEGFEPVQMAEEKARSLGVNSVPFFRFNQKLAVSGAQSPQAFVDVFEQISLNTKE